MTNATVAVGPQPPVGSNTVFHADTVDFSYSLNGVAVPEILTDVVFWPTQEDGLFTMYFEDGWVFDLLGQDVGASGELSIGTFVAGNDRAVVNDSQPIRRRSSPGLGLR